LKINPIDYYVSFGLTTRPPKVVRSNRGELKTLCTLEKWKTSVFPYLMTNPKCSSKKDIIW